jgi:hypothetical protein
VSSKVLVVYILAFYGFGIEEEIIAVIPSGCQNDWRSLFTFLVFLLYYFIKLDVRDSLNIKCSRGKIHNC